MAEDFRDYIIDSELNIRTTGRNDKYSDTHRYPYEPTAYSVLDRIINEEYIGSKDVLLDYGCGKGRVPIYLCHKLKCRGIGIEMVKEFFKAAKVNVKNAGMSDRIEIVNGRAEQYNIPDDVTACFFFNPFDLGIMRGVMSKIIMSYRKCNRRIRLFFYYPQDEYLQFFSTISELKFIQDVNCMDLFAEDENRNKVVIYELGMED